MDRDDLNYVASVDLGRLPPVIFTFTINPTPSDAVVTINGEIRNSITVELGTTLEWSVTKDRYISQSGSEIMTSDLVREVTLQAKMFTFTIDPNPSDSTVTINGSNTKSITLIEGSNISWTVFKDGYITQSGNQNLTEDTTLRIILVEDTPDPDFKFIKTMGEGGFTPDLDPSEYTEILPNENGIYPLSDITEYSVGIISKVEIRFAFYWTNFGKYSTDKILNSTLYVEVQSDSSGSLISRVYTCDGTTLNSIKTGAHEVDSSISTRLAGNSKIVVYITGALEFTIATFD